MNTVHVVLPNDIDDPATPSGGNVYDRRVCAGLAATGWAVHEHPVPGGWPRPSAAERAALAAVLAALPDGAVVLADGLVGSAAPGELGAEADRLRLVLLVHMLVGGAAEERAVTAARAVVTTSEWAKRDLCGRYAVPAGRVRVAAPGVDPAPPAAGSADGSRLLCVAAVTPHKGHDVLAAALATVPGAWSCVCVGALTRDPGFAAALPGVAGLRFTGALTGAALHAAYADADLLVLPSRGETYGMVVTEALARGIPVVGTDAGGLPEALGHAPDNTVPGLLVPPGDPVALAAALRRWLGEPALRDRLRRAALARRDTLTGWADTSRLVATTLDGART